MRKRFAFGLILLITPSIVLLYARFLFEPVPLTSQQIAHKAGLLNDMAAVFVPHKLLDFGKTRSSNLALFQHAEQGVEMPVRESQAYRLSYQSVLQRSQAIFRFFDGDIQVLQDLAMDHMNNVEGMGVSGIHDHHDGSARQNFAQMSEHLHRLQQEPDLGHWTRIWLALQVNKDLVDILLHLGTVPQTKSVGYLPPATMARRDEDLFEQTLAEYKLAQFEPVNSPAYRSHISRALSIYSQLVLFVQKDLYEQLTSFERYFVGNWGGWQSLSPITLGYTPERPMMLAPADAGIASINL